MFVVVMESGKVDHLKSLCGRIRSGEIDEAVLGVGRSLLSTYRQDSGSKEYLQALSLTAEAAEQLGQLEAMERVIANPAKSILRRFQEMRIEDRVRRGTEHAESDYRLVRQEIWCLLAYARSCYNFRRFPESIDILELLQNRIESAIGSTDWPRNQMFRGTRARLHYYHGIVLRRSKPLLAFRHFRRAIDCVWERWEQQKRDHKCDDTRLDIEYQYCNSA